MRRLFALCAMLVAPGASAAEQYTVFAVVKAPHGANRAALEKALRKEGYGARAEGERELAMVLTAAEIEKLFSGKITRRTVAAGSRPGMIEQAYLESARIPPRFARYIRRVYLDPQRG